MTAEAGVGAKRILIVEDEGLLALNMRQSIERYGYRVVGVVPSGERAVALAKGLVPDLIIMDIKLKGSMDGIEAVEQIRASNCKAPVLFITAHADAATLERAMKTSPVGYLRKPVEDHLWGQVMAEAFAHS
jgi:CheY-like chemotaxis protein